MKLFIKTCILFLCITNISCDSLELEPLNSIASENFYISGENLNAGLHGIYDALQLNGVYGKQLQLDGISDNCIVVSNFTPDMFAFAAGSQLQVASSFIDMYQDGYVVIQRANLLLDNADLIEGIAPDDEDLIAAKAEARALRALAYMKLVYLFGDVPFTLTTMSREEALQISRTDRNTVIDFVLDEFAATAALLNAVSSDGRLTKQAVLGFHAKVMLYEARIGNQTWANALTAINAAKSAAINGGHSLVDTDTPDNDYKSLFTEANEGNSEFIFSVKFSSIDLSTSYKEEFSWDAGALFMHIHQNFADAYDYADGSDYNPIDDTYVGRDPRLSVNIMHEGLTFNGLTYDGTDTGGFVSSNSPGTATNLFVNKFCTTDFTSSFNEGTLDVPVLRYADILLMEAEALNETGGDGHTPLNLVRDRAGLPALSGLSQSALKDEIIHERRVELAFEGQRWFDLITLGIAENTINAIVEENATVDRGFTVNRNELLPIPQTEIEANPNLLPQNPGY
ncbi:RagB/SusD family nutrient uptake outer membrane protein [Flavivirga jejuensis]|uniref:RagB/SusD family nutrient uptake outer membrane protein n=1 Tax=Flavivirga jejuensis TaxID=870487 RepID=A0ABT8WQV8_9FLAO|nr:RagB/SusD family nutrient uptake outer membrane protein [Flavivirga jejuensis]MDO5975533.1 RagB/SusD family nutrient uptake outer membrane protein [Flavivirga jejuensis]